MKKKLLSIALSLVMGLGCMSALVACGGDPEADKEALAKAVQALEVKYDSDTATDTDYDLLAGGTVMVSGKAKKYTATWSVSSDFKDVKKHVDIGKKNSDNLCHVTISKADVRIDYKLTATVKVNKQKDTVSFNHYISANAKKGDGTESNPYSVAQVFEIASTMTPKPKLEASDNPKPIFATGYIIDCGTDQRTAKNPANRVGFVKIVDTYSADKNKNDADVLTILSINYDDTTPLTDYSDLKLGAKITVRGYIMNYQKNAESEPYGEITYYGDDGIKCTYLEKEELTNQQKVVRALEKVADTFRVTTTDETPLPTSSSSEVTFSWALTDSSKATVTVTVNDGKIKVSSLPTADEKVTVTVTATCGTDGEASKPVTVTIVGTNSPKYGTAENPYTVAKIREVFDELVASANNGDLAEPIYIKGYVTDKGKTYKDGQCLSSVVIGDSATATETFMFYDLAWNETLMGAFNETTPISVGDYLLVKGSALKKYGSTLEMVKTSANILPEIITWTKNTTPAPTGTFTPITTPVAGTYKFAMQKSDGWYYMTGAMSGFYFATSTESSQAADVVLEKVGEDGWILKQGNRFIEIERQVDGEKTYNNVKFNDAQTSGKYWKWNDTHKIFVWEIEDDTFWLGTDTFKTFSANNLTKLTGTDAAKQCPAKLGTISSAD